MDTTHTHALMWREREREREVVLSQSFDKIKNLLLLANLLLVKKSNAFFMIDVRPMLNFKDVHWAER